MNLVVENGRHKNAWAFSICIILDYDNFDVCDSTAVHIAQIVHCTHMQLCITYAYAMHVI